MEVLVEVWLKFGRSFAAGFGSKKCSISIKTTRYHGVKKIAQRF